MIMRDNRIRILATADEIARNVRHYPLFVFKSDNAKAVYIFGRRVFASKVWNGHN